jgi:hypothetical protein
LSGYGSGDPAPLPFGEGKTPDVANVDPRLNKILAAAATHLGGGYKVVVNEGYNPSGHTEKSFHHVKGSGALDIQIVDPQGKPIPNEGADSTGKYRELARAAYGEMLARYPELKGKFAWGGAFGTVKGGNVPDLMHFDLGGERGHFADNRPSALWGGGAGGGAGGGVGSGFAGGVGTGAAAGDVATTGGGANIGGVPGAFSKTFSQAGLTPIAISGILGNVQQESGFRMTVKGDQGRSFGSMQWDPIRTRGLIASAHRNGLDPASPEAQAKFAVEEAGRIRVGDGTLLEAMNKAKSPTEAANLWAKYFEKPKTIEASRGRYAENFFKTGAAGSGGAAGGVSAGGAGQPTGAPGAAGAAATPPAAPAAAPGAAAPGAAPGAAAPGAAPLQELPEISEAEFGEQYDRTHTKPPDPDQAYKQAEESATQKMKGRGEVVDDQDVQQRMDILRSRNASDEAQIKTYKELQEEKKSNRNEVDKIAEREYQRAAHAQGEYDKERSSWVTGARADRAAARAQRHTDIIEADKKSTGVATEKHRQAEAASTLRTQQRTATQSMIGDIDREIEETTKRINKMLSDFKKMSDWEIGRKPKDYKPEPGAPEPTTMADLVRERNDKIALRDKFRGKLSTLIDEEEREAKEGRPATNGARGDTQPTGPGAAAPSTAAPSTAAPSTAAPSTAAPSTAAPSTAAPSIAAPSTAAPSTAAPSTAAPTGNGAAKSHLSPAEQKISIKRAKEAIKNGKDRNAVIKRLQESGIPTDGL